MKRFLILMGYFVLMLYLQLSGKLNQYINVHYRYLAILSMILAIIFAGVQLIEWDKESQGNEEKKTSCQKDHHHGLEKKYQKIMAYFLLSIPLIVGFVFPTIPLDTSIVEAKGFNFPISKESVGDKDIETQYLKPDTSIYFEQKEYKKQMDKVLKNYDDLKKIDLTEENYLEIMELIYNYPSEFIGKEISYTGFIFHSNEKGRQKSDTFVFRFGIIHCVADSGVFGLLTKMPEGKSVKNNDWVKLSGVIKSEYYQPFKRTLPMVEVSQVKEVDEPKNQYVYRSF